MSFVNCPCGSRILKKNWKRHATEGKPSRKCKVFYLKGKKKLTITEQIDIAMEPLQVKIEKLEKTVADLRRTMKQTKNYMEKKIGSKEAEKHAFQIMKRLEVPPPNNRDLLIELSTYRDEKWLRECCQLANQETEFVKNLWWFHYLKRFCDVNGGVFWKFVRGKQKEIVSIEIGGIGYSPEEVYYKVFENFRKLSTVVFQEIFNQFDRDEKYFNQLTLTCNNRTFEYTDNGKWPDPYAPCPLDVVPVIELEHAFQIMYNEAVSEKRKEIYKQLREEGEID